MCHHDIPPPLNPSTTTYPELPDFGTQEEFERYLMVNYRQMDPRKATIKYAHWLQKYHFLDVAEALRDCAYDAMFEKWIHESRKIAELIAAVERHYSS
jgi:hypothetical protein